MIVKLKSFANNAASKTNGTKLKIKLDSTLYKKEKYLLILKELINTLFRFLIVVLFFWQLNMDFKQ